MGIDALRSGRNPGQVAETPSYAHQGRWILDNVVLVPYLVQSTCLDPANNAVLQPQHPRQNVFLNPVLGGTRRLSSAVVVTVLSGEVHT